MTTDPVPASLVNNFSSSGDKRLPQAYYRSKLFVAPFTTNPMVAAAGPLLSLLERLCLSPTLPSIPSICENIDHELKAFHSSLNNKAYTEELDAIAHYLLCATLDELVAKNYQRVNNISAEFKAFTPAAIDQVGADERFFAIVDYLKQSPNQFLDLIELSYYCLIVGFEGKYHFAANGRQVLDDLLEELFQIIQLHRVNKPMRLFKETKKTERLTRTNRRPLLIVAAVSFTLLLAGYFASYALLENKVKMVQFGHTVLAKLDN